MLQCSSHDVNLLRPFLHPHLFNNEISSFSGFILTVLLSLSYFDGPRSEAVMHFESFVRPQATLHPPPEFLFSGFCLILPLSWHLSILSYILGESFSWHGTMQADLRIEARICTWRCAIHLEQNAEMHLVCSQTIVCCRIPSGFQLELEDIRLLKLCVTVSLGQADNLDMFNHNFPYRRTGKGLRVIFPEACGHVSAIVR